MSSDDSTWIFPAVMWIVSFVVALIGLFATARRPPMLGALGLLVVLNPLTDRGAFLVPWDTADTVPFTGLWIAGAAITSALLLLVSTQPPAVTASSSVRRISAPV